VRRIGCMLLLLVRESLLAPTIVRIPLHGLREGITAGVGTRWESRPSRRAVPPGAPSQPGGPPRTASHHWQACEFAGHLTLPPPT